jgi:PAS domain S-box-containing protein
MLRHSPPVAVAAGKTRPRAAVPHRSATLNPRPTIPTRSERLNPEALGLGQLFVHTRDAVVVANIDSGLIVLWNPAAERLFGWSADEAIGRPIVTLVPPAILRLHLDEQARYRRTGYPTLTEPGRPFEIPALRKDGEEVRVDLTLAALEHAGSPAQYVLAMLRDTSDRRRADLQTLEAARTVAALEDAEHALQQHQQSVQAGANELKRELHHLRRSSTRLGRHIDGRNAPRLAQRARIVQARLDRVQQMFDEVFTGAAIQAGTLELSTERINLVPLVARVVAEKRTQSPHCKLNMALPQGLTAAVDPPRIEQLIRALLDQAMLRNPRGCWVDVDLRRPLVGLARLEIRDYGRTVTDAVRQRLLDPVYADRGLALSRQIVEQHGGTLSIEFPAEGGVRVAVTLPTQRGRVLPGAAAD